MLNALTNVGFSGQSGRDALYHNVEHTILVNLILPVARAQSSMTPNVKLFGRWQLPTATRFRRTKPFRS